jgi:beta-lactamase regulating signal transducer with metallopeptidase domain
MTVEIFSSILLVLLNGTLILGISLLATRLLGWSTASLRHLILFSALFSMVLFIPTSSILPTWSMPGLPDLALLPDTSVSEQAGATETKPDIGGEAEEEDAVAAREGEGFSNERSSPGAVRSAESNSLWATLTGLISSHLPWIALTIWAAGSVVILIIQLVRWAGAGFIASMASAVENPDQLQLAARIRNKLQLRNAVALLRSEMTAVTMAWGIRRPCIILPADYNTWGGERIEAVLQHEFAHIKRKDNLLHLFTVVASALFWFNPLVWIVMRKLNYEREVACDDQVLNSGIYASSYARHLMDLNVRLTGPKSERIIPAVMAHSSNIKRRLLSILDPKVNRRPLKPLNAFLYPVLILALAMPVAAFQPWTTKTDDDHFTFTGRIHAAGPDLYNVFYLDGKDCEFYPDKPLDFKLLASDSFLVLCKHNEDPAVRFEVRVGENGEYITTYYLDDIKQVYDHAAEALFHRLLQQFGSGKDSHSILSDEDYGRRRSKVLKGDECSIDGKDYSFDSKDPLNFKLLSPDAYMILTKNDVELMIEFKVRFGADGKYITTYYRDGRQQIYDENAEALFHRLLMTFWSGGDEESSGKDHSDWYRKWRAGELDYADAYNEWLTVVVENRDLIFREAYMKWKESRAEEKLLHVDEYRDWLESQDKEQILTEAFIRWMETESLEKSPSRNAATVEFLDENKLTAGERAISVGDTIDMLLGGKGDLSLDFKHAEIDVDTDWLYRITEPNGYLIITRLVDDKIHRYEIRSSRSGRITKKYTVDGAERRFDEIIEKQFRDLLRSMFDLSESDEPSSPN